MLKLINTGITPVTVVPLSNRHDFKLRQNVMLNETIDRKLYFYRGNISYQFGKVTFRSVSWQHPRTALRRQ